MWLAERELLLIKVGAGPGPARTEVMQLCDIFRARVVDVSDVSITVCATGDAGKVGLQMLPFMAMQHLCSKFMC